VAKYNPKNLQHRSWLAQNILSILPKWGFEMETEKYGQAHCWEFVLKRKDKFNPSKYILVFTSIEKQSGAVRACGDDAIRIVALREDEIGEIYPLYRKKVNRTGEFKNITSRVIDAIKEAQRA